MYKRILFAALFFISMAAYAQDDITLCHTPSTEKFAMFASNKDFNREHAAPAPYVHVSSADGRLRALINQKLLDIYCNRK
jgi:carboxymethylenebutenolidase